MIKLPGKYVIGAIALTASAAAYALPAYVYTTYYWSDASHTTLVGYKEIDCFGEVTNDGQQTSYTTFERGEQCYMDKPIPK